MALSAISMNSAIANKEFVLSLYHKLQDLKMQYQQTEGSTRSINQTINQSINQSFYMNNVNVTVLLMKLSPGIYSTKESYKIESHKTNLTV